MLENKENDMHSVLSQSRKNISVSGVRDVHSFDDKGVVLNTVCGNMAIEGEELRVTVLNLDNGRVEVEGRICGVFYFEESQSVKKGLFGKK